MIQIGVHAFSKKLLFSVIGDTVNRHRYMLSSMCACGRRTFNIDAFCLNLLRTYLLQVPDFPKRTCYHHYPGKREYPVKSIPNELENLQQAVGGDIEMTYPFDDEVGILLNGNGKFEGLPLNRALYDDHGQVYDAIAGTFLVVGLTEDDFTSLTPEQIEKFKEKYQSPEIFTLFNGELHVMKMPPEEEKEQKESRKNDAKQKNPAKKKNRSGDAR